MTKILKCFFPLSPFPVPLLSNPSLKARCKCPPRNVELVRPLQSTALQVQPSFSLLIAPCRPSIAGRRMSDQRGGQRWRRLAIHQQH